MRVNSKRKAAFKITLKPFDKHFHSNLLQYLNKLRCYATTRRRIENLSKESVTQ